MKLFSIPIRPARRGSFLSALIFVAAVCSGCGATKLLPKLTAEERALLEAPARKPKAGVRAGNEGVLPYLEDFRKDVEDTGLFSEVVVLTDLPQNVDVILTRNRGCQDQEICLPLLYGLTLGIIPDLCRLAYGHHFDTHLPGEEVNKTAVSYCQTTTMALGYVMVPLALLPNWTWLGDPFRGRRYSDRFALALIESPQMQKLRHTSEPALAE